MTCAKARPAVLADAPAIASIGRVAVPRTYEGVITPTVVATVVDQLYTDEAVEACLAASAQKPNSLFLVAEVDREVVGFLHYDDLGSEPELHRIYLQPDAIGSGVGTVLMDALHANLPAGAGYILMVIADNEGAIAFYRRHGLVVREKIDAMPYYRAHMGVAIPSDAPPISAVIMERRVPLT